MVSYVTQFSCRDVLKNFKVITFFQMEEWKRVKDTYTRYPQRYFHY